MSDQVTIKLKVSTLNKILSELGKMKFKLVHQLITKIQSTASIEGEVGEVTLSPTDIEFILNESIIELPYVEAAPMISEISESYATATEKLSQSVVENRIDSDVATPRRTKVVEVADEMTICSDAINDR